MDGKIKYKIVSCSSEQPNNPVTNILVRGSTGWESARFCSYPQQITLQFYGEVRLKQLQFLSNNRKITSRIDILYYSTASSNSAVETRFTKYGFLELSPNDHTNYEGRELKTIMVDIRCTYLRLLLHKNHYNKQNFFSQIGLHEVNCIGEGYDLTRPTSGKMGELGQVDASALAAQAFTNINSNNSGVNVEDDYIKKKLIILLQLKDQAVKAESYDEAKKMRDTISSVRNLGYQIRGLEDKKREAVENQDYQSAQKLKGDIEKVRIKADVIIAAATGTQQGTAMTTRRKTNPNQNSFEEENLENSRVLSQVVKTHENEFVESMGNQETDQLDTPSKPLKISYDDRVLPTHLSKPKQQPNEQEGFGKEQLPADPEPVPAKYEKQAQVLSTVLNEHTIRKFYSKYWQFRNDALNTALRVLKESKPKDFGTLFKVYVILIAGTIDQKVVQIAQASMQLLMELLQQYDKSHKQAKQTMAEVQAEIDKILNQVAKRLNDNNAKLKGQADEVYRKMASSGLYGASTCSNILIKVNPKTKLAAKQIKARLDMLTYFISLYGLGGNGVPLSSIDFASSHIDNQASQVRNSAIDLLVEASMHDQEDRVMNNLERLPANMKEVIIKKISNAKNSRNTVPVKKESKPKK